MARDKTQIAFDEWRSGKLLQPVHPDAVRYDGDTDLMGHEDGACSWDDGEASTQTPVEIPIIEATVAGKCLWVVTDNDVIYALEVCPFGLGREAKAVKHSNLTGGADAYAGGELVFVDGQTIVLNGCSGRYRIQNAEDMRAVASAFRQSGYRVWSMGWNFDVDRPALFGLQDPEWIAA